MRTLEMQALLRDSTRYGEVQNVLEQGGLVCLPSKTSYRIIADLTNPEAVNRLHQSKHRTQKAPSLVFIAEPKMLSQVAQEIPAPARKLAQQLWPGPLTILFSAHPDLPPKVVKSLIKANGKIGVRIPDEVWVKRIVSDLGRPVLVSSANREKKVGAGSPAQVRKNFSRHVDLFIDAGELSLTEPSTVVDFQDGLPIITRQGAIPSEHITALFAP